MERYCDQCGAKLDSENAQFCNKCGASVDEIPAESKSLANKKTIIILLVVIIILLSMLIFATGALDFRKHTDISIKTTSSVPNEGDFEVALTSNEGGLSGKEITVTFKNDKDTYQYSAKTNSEGIATVHPSVNLGDYEVTCEFKGDVEYSSSSVKKQITVKEQEPDYEAYYYSNSFEDTDKNNDGYVLLSDMNIVHTPENVKNQMFADSDDDGDGKLNKHEYYKFMYKLNYDYHSYGL